MKLDKYEQTPNIGYIEAHASHETSKAGRVKRIILYLEIDRARLRIFQPSHRLGLSVLLIGRLEGVLELFQRE